MEYLDHFEPDKVIVALHKDDSSSHVSVHNINEILTGIAVEKVEYLLDADQDNTQSPMGDVILVYLKEKSKAAVLDAIQKLMENPHVLYAEPDYLYDVDILPNDPYYNYLWGLEKIHSPLAWQYSMGNPNVVVGVLDSGVDYNHPDLKDNMWISSNGEYQNGWNFINDSSSPLDETGHGTHVAGTIRSCRK